MRLFLTLLLFTASQFVFSQNLNPEKVATKLLDQLEAGQVTWHSVHIVLADRVDLASLDAELSSRRSKANERSNEVINALKIKALETQTSLLNQLSHSENVQQNSVRAFWIANAIFAKMKKEEIAALSNRDDVAWIGLNGKLKVEKVEKTPPPPTFEPGLPEAGLLAINAPFMWKKGYTGYGQVAFTNDTGIDPTHPAIASRYRGFYVPKTQTWFEIDSVNFEPTGNFDPFDCQEHGTHVTGTILGLDRCTDDTIGVAFNAQWIGAPILCGIGTEDNVGAFQWALDPDGDPLTADDMPDIINNSWYDPSLDSLDCFSIYVPVLEAMEAAGIAVIFSAGNEGPDAMTITQPHNININELNSFTVGALNANVPNLPIASFSSRGPSHCAGDSSLLIKPEVSAPGVNVRSCVPGEKYDLFSGTSMAAPHTSGAVLLLKEAFPELTGKELKNAIYHSCTDLGNPGEDNVFGMGIINVEAAFNYLVAQGHTPVSPFRANDVLLIDMQVSPFSCENKVVPEVKVENSGTDTVTSFEVFYEAGTFNQTYLWTGVLAPGERSVFMLPALLADAGTYALKVTLQNPNGVPDERPLNNIFIKNILVSDRQHFEVGIEGGQDGVCENGKALLRGQYNGAGSVEVSWYDVPFGGNKIGEGQAFATPPLAQPATYFAQAKYSVPLGLGQDGLGDNFANAANDIGLVFDVLSPMTIQSIYVHVETTGARLFAVENENGSTVKQAVKSISDTGWVKVTLNWNIPAGKNFRFIKTLGKPLSTTVSGAIYPYTIADIVTIKNTTDNLAGTGGWHFFYNWQVSFDEPCGRAQVDVPIIAGAGSPGASFSVSTNQIDLATDDGKVDFTNTSTDNIASFLWNFGDNTTSTDEQTSHTFDAAGNYVVSLTVVGLGGCTDFALDTIEVQGSPISGINPKAPIETSVAVFPNPFTENVEVYFELDGPQPVRLTLVDLTGRVVKTADYQYVAKDKITLSANGVAPGVYFLMVGMKEGTQVWRVVKI